MTGGSTSTSWERVAAEHLNHRTILRDARTLECVDCARKLILPRDTAATPTPNAYRKPDAAGVPMPPNFRERVWADLKHRREQRAQQYPEATS